MPSSKVDSFVALADPTRRSILELLHQHEVLTAGDIAGRYPHMSRAAISKHLGTLRRARIVRARRRGRQVLYRLEPEALRPVAHWLTIFGNYWDDSLQRLKREAER